VFAADLESRKGVARKRDYRCPAYLAVVARTVPPKFVLSADEFIEYAHSAMSS
jgi:hypothetical protein